MKTTLHVNEIFYSLQGEGIRTGEPSLFVRLAHCDLQCVFCDTEFASFVEMNLDEVIKKCEELSPTCKWIVWTGGEPSLQLSEEIVAYFRTAGFFQAIETNGNNVIPNGLDFVCVSPKVAEHVLLRNFKTKRVDELRYVRHEGQAIPDARIVARKYYLSPAFDGDVPNKANIEHCIKLCKDNPQWSLNIQMHKLLKLR